MHGTASVTASKGLQRRRIPGAQRVVLVDEHQNAFAVVGALHIGIERPVDVGVYGLHHGVVVLCGVGDLVGHVPVVVLFQVETLGFELFCEGGFLLRGHHGGKARCFFGGLSGGLFFCGFSCRFRAGCSLSCSSFRRLFFRGDALFAVFIYELLFFGFSCLGQRPYFQFHFSIGDGAGQLYVFCRKRSGHQIAVFVRREKAWKAVFEPAQREVTCRPGVFSVFCLFGDLYEVGLYLFGLSAFRFGGVEHILAGLGYLHGFRSARLYIASGCDEVFFIKALCGILCVCAVQVYQAFGAFDQLFRIHAPGPEVGVLYSFSAGVDSRVRADEAFSCRLVLFRNVLKLRHRHGILWRAEVPVVCVFYPECQDRGERSYHHRENSLLFHVTNLSDCVKTIELYHKTQL